MGLDGLGVQYEGMVTVASAPFVTGTVTNGEVMEFKVTTGAVPEPSTWAMLAAGAASLLAFRRRR